MVRKRDANGQWPKQKQDRSGRKYKSGARKRKDQSAIGNGKKTAYWFTLNNYTEEEQFNIMNAVAFYPDYIRYVDFGKEIGGKKKTPHLQGQIELTLPGI